MRRLLRYAFASILLFIAFGVLITLVVEPYEVPPKPPIQRPEMASTFFAMSDGSRLPFLSWSPSARPRAVVVALHGGGHYSSTMAPLGESLLQHEIATYAYDLRGHGGAPNYGKSVGGDVLTRDLAEIVVLIRAKHQQTPIFLAGLSFGATVVINAVGTSGFPDVAGAILISPGIDRPQLGYRLLSSAIGIAARLLPEATFAISFEDQSDGSADYLAHERSDPLNMKTMELNYAYGGIRQMERTGPAAAALDLPVLVLFGHKDSMANETTLAAFARRIPGPTRAVGYPDGYHVLIWDRQREVVFGDIASWIFDHDGRFPSLAGTPPSSIEVDLRMH